MLPVQKIPTDLQDKESWKCDDDGIDELVDAGEAYKIAYETAKPPKKNQSLISDILDPRSTPKTKISSTVYIKSQA